MSPGSILTDEEEYPTIEKPKCKRKTCAEKVCINPGPEDTACKETKCAKFYCNKYEDVTDDTFPTTDPAFITTDEENYPTIKTPKCKEKTCAKYNCKTYSQNNASKCIHFECEEFYCRDYEDVLTRLKRSDDVDYPVKCILIDNKCDGVLDCPNGRDEDRKVCGMYLNHEW